MFCAQLGRVRDARKRVIGGGSDQDQSDEQFGVRMTVYGRSQIALVRITLRRKRQTPPHTCLALRPFYMLRWVKGFAMLLDVAELRGFYETPLGQIARQILTREITTVWPNASAERVVGVGHPTPFLRPFVGKAERVMALMPAAAGVLPWPKEGLNCTALAYPDHLPLPDSSVDKLLLIHLVENAPDPQAVLREAWRVLMPAGRVLVVTPYRAGAWARADHTPFGLGRPFTRFQLHDLLESASLDPVDVRRCLFVPPTERRFVLRSARAWESFGRRVFPRLGGVLMVEATKVLVRGIPAKRAPQRIKVFAPVLGGAAKPAAYTRSSGRQGPDRTGEL